jgi:hypothetical protein
MREQSADAAKKAEKEAEKMQKGTGKGRKRKAAAMEAACSNTIGCRSLRPATNAQLSGWIACAIGSCQEQF